MTHCCYTKPARRGKHHSPRTAKPYTRRRLAQRTAECFRLRCLLAACEAQFCNLTPGAYLRCDNGELEGPHDNLENAAHHAALHGLGGVMLQVLRRFEATDIP